MNYSSIAGWLNALWFTHAVGYCVEVCETVVIVQFGRERGAENCLQNASSCAKGKKGGKKRMHMCTKYFRKIHLKNCNIGCR